MSDAARTLVRPTRRRDPLVVVPAVAVALFLAPIGAGLIGTWLPAFGWLPALGGHAVSLEPWRRLFEAPELPSAIALTLLGGVLATTLSLGLVVGFCAACHDTRAFAAVRHLLSPLLAIPHASLAIGFAFLIAPSGWISRLLSTLATSGQTPPDWATVQDPYGLALIGGLVVKEAPYLLLMVVGALGQADAARSLAIARSLGYGPVQAWLTVVFPRVYPQIRLPIFAVLAFSLSVVDMAIILAPTTPPPLAPLLLRWFNDPDLAIRFPAAAGATLQLALVGGSILIWYAGERLAAPLLRGWCTRGARRLGGDAVRVAGGAAMVLVVTLAFLSIAGLVVWSAASLWRFPSLLPTAWSFQNWLSHGAALGWPAWTTLTVGLAATILAVVLVLGCLENEQRRGLHPGRRTQWLMYAPLLVPQISFLFGFQILLARIGLDGSWVGIVWSHLLFVFPYVFLTLADPYRALDSRYARSAHCLGASPSRVFWRIRVPLLLRPICIALAVGFAVSVAQYLPTLFAGGGRYATLTTEAVALSAGADRRVIGVYASAQALMPLLPFALALAAPAWPRVSGRRS